MHSLSMESTGLRVMIHIHGMRFGGQNYLCIAMALVGLGTTGWKITASVLGEPDLDFNFRSSRPKFQHFDLARSSQTSLNCMMISPVHWKVLLLASAADCPSAVTGNFSAYQFF